MRQFILGLFLFTALAAGAQTVNPFTSKSSGPDQAVTESANNGTPSGPVPVTISGGFQAFSDLLAQLNHQLSDLIAAVSDPGTGNFQLPYLLLLILLSFFYGIIHGLGPGHGKSAAGGFFLGRDARVHQPLLLGVFIAVLHAVVSITLVLVLFFIIKGIFLLTFGQASAWTGAFGYGLVALMGLFMAASALVGLLTKGRSHLHFFRVCSDDHHGSGHNHDHEHGENCGCGHEHHDQSAEQPAGVQRPTNPGVPLRSLVLLALGVAIVPCPGAVTVMLFAVVQKVPQAGIAAVIALSAGMALTVSAAGLLSLLIRRGILQAGRSPKKPRGRYSAYLWTGILQLTGSLVLVLFGAGLFVQNLANF